MSFEVIRYTGNLGVGDENLRLGIYNKDKNNIFKPYVNNNIFIIYK